MQDYMVQDVQAPAGQLLRQDVRLYLRLNWEDCIPLQPADFLAYEG